MKARTSLILVLLLILVGTLPGVAAPPEGWPALVQPTAAESGNLQPAARTEPLIIDHTCTDLSEIPPYWIEQAKELHRLSYGHTSHGSQIISGMGVLRADPTYGGLYAFNTDGSIEAGILSLRDTWPPGDLGNPDRVTWASRTRDYLNGVYGDGTDRTIVVWSWCGQAETSNPANIDTYLNLMDGLEQEFPNVTFVYMTGHLAGTGVAGHLNQRNEQIRAFCRANNKVLFDFADIESYDPDGNAYLALDADDECDYDSDGNGSLDSNWADEWCAANPGDPLCASCGCAHSKPLNCNLKARAFWWMLAMLAGWDGGVGDAKGGTKTASPIGPADGETVNYAIVIKGFTTTVYLTDIVPPELSYAPGTLSATSGAFTDTGAPILRWSGTLPEGGAVTVTYDVVASTGSSDPQVVTNTASMVAPGYGSATARAVIIVNGHNVFLPLIGLQGP
jgi:hypothetical protein